MDSADLDEQSRLDTLKSYAILDTPPEADFDRLTRLAARICEMPIATMTLVDERRQWFKSVIGMDLHETDRAIAFCAHSIRGKGMFVVPDTRKDPLFNRNPLVVAKPGIRFYAGVPLVSPGGFALGTLAVMDRVSRCLTAEQMEALETLAEQVMMTLELRRQRNGLANLIAERERMNATLLRDGQNMVQIAGRMAHVGGWHAELPDGRVSWSDEVCAIHEMAPGTSPTVAEGINFYAPEWREKISDVFGACVRHGAPFDEELQILTAKGRRVWARVIGEAVRDAGGTITRVQGAFQDITEKKQAERTLFQSQQRFRQLADAMPQIVWTAEPDGMVDYANQALTDYTGIPAAELSDQHWANVLHPEDLDSYMAMRSESVRTGSPYSCEIRIRRGADGSCHWHLVKAVPVRDEDGKIVKWYGTATDIHDRRGADEQVRRLAARLTTTLESITDAFFTLDREWRFTYLNNEAELLLQRTRADLVGKVVWDEFKDAVGSTFDREYHRAIRDNCTVAFEQFYPPLGLWFEVHAYPSDEGLAVHFHDFSERRRTTLELTRTNRALRMLSACHEALIRTEQEPVLLEAICRIAVEIGGYRMAWVGFAQENDARTIVPAAHAGEEAGYLQRIPLSWSDDQPAGRGPAGRAIRTGEVIVVEDLTRDAAFQPWIAPALERGYRGTVCLPLRNRERTFGVLVLYAPEVAQVSTHEVKLLLQLADDLAFGIGNIRSQQERRRIQAAVLTVATGVSASTGEEFFEQLARSMADALGASAGFVARLLPGEPPTARTIAAVVDGELTANFDYGIEGTPCENLLHADNWIVPDKLAERFPHAAPLIDLRVQAYVGRRLDNSAGQPVGLLFVLFREALKESDFITSTLQIFAARAAAELERQQADARIRDQASLLDKAQDAIIVRGIDYRISFWNKGAERLYGWTSKEALGKSIVDLISGDPALGTDATNTVLELGEWNGEIVQRRKDGSVFTVEGRWSLVKDDNDRPQSILEINTDITQRKATEKEVKQLAFYDQLTRLPNRLLLLDRLQQALAGSARSRHMGALLFIDLDNFKTLNDTLGHDKGDLLLQRVALRLTACVRESDTVARLGGDEFVVMLEALSQNSREAAAQTKIVGEKILAAFNQPYQLDGYEHHSTPSIGATLFNGQLNTVDELLKRADLAMYQAKAAGRNTMRFFDPEMQAIVTTRAELEADLRRALQRGELLLHYQPQVDRDGCPTGAEALVRWQHAQRGLVSPVEFIPLAEETGLILALGQWVLQAACAQLVAWAARPETEQVSVAVNVSSRQFRHPEFVNQVLAVLDRTGANPQKLRLELTESLLLDNVEDTIAKMSALKTRGVSFALDDFGTGYSSLSYLKRLPLDHLKIDRSFVRDVLTDSSDAAIARTIVALGQSLGLAVIAEGVETEAQRIFLAGIGCHAYQGYLFSRPLPAEQFEAFVLRKKRP